MEKTPDPVYVSLDLVPIQNPDPLHSSIIFGVFQDRSCTVEKLDIKVTRLCPLKLDFSVPAPIIIDSAHPSLGDLPEHVKLPSIYKIRLNGQLQVLLTV